MQRFIPQNAETRDYPAAAVIAYCFESNGRPAFIAYKGRQSKAAQRLAFQNAENRDKYLADYVARETEREDNKRARQQAEHGLEVGDILVSVWGYDQTNATFFQVVRLPSARSAVIRQITATVTPKPDHSMTGHSEPKPGEFDAQAAEETRRATGLHTLTAGKHWHGELHKWDGKPARVTFYA